MRWIFYPKTKPLPEFLRETVKIFESAHSEIDSTNLKLKSDDVLSILTPRLESIGYKVEKSKKGSDKIRVSVLYGELGKEKLAFEADGYSKAHKTVVEVEAGRAVLNNQFLKDIFEASMMFDTDYLVLAVRKYHSGKDDFSAVRDFLEAIYLTNRVKLDLKGILLIGY